MSGAQKDKLEGLIQSFKDTVSIAYVIVLIRNILECKFMFLFYLLVLDTVLAYREQ